MGSRLGTIIKSTAGWEIYYDHWSAQTIGADLAFDGMESTLQRVRKMRLLPIESPTDWDGFPLIEGSLLIDLTTQTIVWSEESDGLYLPRIINYLIEKTWPSWTAVWSPEGERGVLSAAGVDPDAVFTPTDYHARKLEDCPWFGPWSDLNTDDALSIILDDGRSIRWRGTACLDIIAELGPDNIQKVAEKAIHLRENTASDERVSHRSNGKIKDDPPQRGTHIDYQSKAIRWWSIVGEDPEVETFSALWPEWTVESTGDNHEWHSQIFSSQLRPWEVDVSEGQKWLRRFAAEGQRENPLTGIAEFLTSGGADVQLGPTSLDFIASDRGSHRDRILDLLNSFQHDQPLLPARFIDRHGAVHDTRDL